MNQEDLKQISEISEAIRKADSDLRTIRGLLSGKEVSLCIEGKAKAMYKREYRYFIENEGLIRDILTKEEESTKEHLDSLITKLEQFVLIRP